jgi:DNA repair protein RecN (Recombination protein N)
VLRALRIENLALIRGADLPLGPGLVAVTGETGAGKTIFAQAIGLLLGAKGDASAIGSAGNEAYVEAELDVPEGFFDEDGLEQLADLRPEDEPGLVLARRVFADGRTRAYAWGRSIAREDLATAAERLIAMSGQFEQRRLARPSFQIDQLDAFAGQAQLDRRIQARSAGRTLAPARAALAELERDAGAARARLAELQALVDDTADLTPGEEEALRAERELGRHGVELVEGVGAAVEALDPDDGDGAVALTAAAERRLAPLERLAPELAESGEELRDAAVRLREVARELRGVASRLETDPARVEAVEARLQRIAEVRRRHGAATLDELLAQRAEAQAELDAVADGRDPVDAARSAVEQAGRSWAAVADDLSAARAEAAPRFGEAAGAELRDLGMGEGELVVELRQREPGPTGRDEAVFLVRPNAGLPLAPVAETASGGELSRIALALAAVAGGETLVFDEIDAGIGGVTAHRVADALRRLAERAQVLTITHLPQIASVADHHLRVEKVPGDPTHTTIEVLDGDARQAELERMLGGREFVAALTTGQDDG